MAKSQAPAEPRERVQYGWMTDAAFEEAEYVWKEEFQKQFDAAEFAYIKSTLIFFRDTVGWRNLSALMDGRKMIKGKNAAT
jgi:hypothetical protein